MLKDHLSTIVREREIPPIKIHCLKIRSYLLRKGRGRAYEIKLKMAKSVMKPDIRVFCILLTWQLFPNSGLLQGFQLAENSS
jgi:hypothetical protein